METFYLITHLIDSIFIKGLFISVLSIIIVGKALKADTGNAFAIIKWIVLVHGVLSIVYYYMASFSAAEMISFNERAIGPYNLAYYLMMVPNALLPLLLLFKKLSRNKYVLLALSLLMNIGWMLEMYLIYSTYINNDRINNQLSFNFLWFIALKGLLIGAIIYAIGRAVTRKIVDIATS